MSLNLRSNTEIYLIGFESQQILGAKLPNARQVLQTFFYNRRTVGLSVKASAKLVIEEVLIYWEKARIKTRGDHHCIKKVLDLHTKWENLKKSGSRKSETQKKNEKQFIENLDKLFDIAHADALNQMKEDDAEFLINQRKPNREGCLVGVDVKANTKEKRRAERKEKEYIRKKKYEEESVRNKKGNNHIIFHFMRCTDYNFFRSVTYNVQFSSDECTENQTDEEFHVEAKTHNRKNNLINQRIVSVLDNYKVSDRAAAHIIAAVIDALDLSINDYKCSRDFIRDSRKQERKNIATKVKENLNVSSLDFLSQ